MMETRNPDDEVQSWKAQLTPAIVISCESHYGPESSLPTFPWYLEQAPNPEVKELLSRLTFATKHNVKTFSTEVANYLEKLSNQIQDKIRFKYCNHLDLVSVEKKVAELKNPKPGNSRVTVRVTKGSRKVLRVSSESSKTGAIDGEVTVDMSLDKLSIDVDSESKPMEVFSTPPKDMLSELSLERLLLASVAIEQDVALEGGERMTLELKLFLSDADRLQVLQLKMQRLEDIYQATEAEIVRLKNILDGVMNALDIKDEPKRKKKGYRDRGCEYCAVF